MSAMSLCPRPSFPKALKSMYLPPVDSTLAASPSNFLSDSAFLVRDRGGGKTKVEVCSAQQCTHAQPWGLGMYFALLYA